MKRDEAKEGDGERASQCDGGLQIGNSLVQVT